MKNRVEEIKQKGFSMNFGTSTDVYGQIKREPTDFSKIKIGAKVLEDAIINLGTLKQTSPLASKGNVLEAIKNADYAAMREISNFFFRTSGIYSRLCKYYANLYRYDWMVTPYLIEEAPKKDKILTDFAKILTYLDNFGIKKFLGEVALKVMRNGCYYGYVIEQTDRAMIQELSPNYCRSRFMVNGHPAVEFNMKFFDDTYRDTTQRLRVLELFPKEFSKGYVLYKQGKLPAEFPGDTSGWYLLDPKFAIKFNMNDEDYPVFISVIPAILDLDAAQDLDRKKMAQQLLKIIIQKMPLDKNGELVFDIDEAQELHNNAVQMLSKAIGIDVLTTFADVDVADMADKSSVTSIDELEKVERTLYNESGTAQNLFNTDGNIALEKSILNDEASIYNLLLQFEQFLNLLIEKFSSKKISFRAQLLTTTIYNYKDMAKLFKEHTQMGYSKMLPMIALGQSQSSILAAAHFENEILNLVELFIPPITSNQMNTDMIQKKNGNGESGEGAGRKEKPNDQKSEKTVANIESKG